MANFEILRMQRLKSFYSIRRSVKHAFRAQETPNADPDRFSQNTHFFADDVATAMQNFKNRMPEKIRKNAVYAVEFLITASPEAMKSKNRQAQDSYFSDALKFLQDKHGAENVVFAGVHRDETTPHMYAYVVPIDERGKLNCRKFYGAKNALSDLQSEFHAAVGEQHGFDRGIKGSKAKHQSIATYYTKLNNRLRPEAVAPTPERFLNVKLQLSEQVDRNVQLQAQYKKYESEYSDLIHAFDDLEPSKRVELLQTLEPAIADYMYGLRLSKESQQRQRDIKNLSELEVIKYDLENCSQFLEYQSLSDIDKLNWRIEKEQDFEYLSNQARAEANAKSAAEKASKPRGFSEMGTLDRLKFMRAQKEKQNEAKNSEYGLDEPEESQDYDAPSPF